VSDTTTATGSTIPPQREGVAIDGDAVDFEAFRREKSRKEKAEKALKAAGAEELAEFSAWQAERTQQAGQRESAKAAAPKSDALPKGSSLLPSPEAPMKVARVVEKEWRHSDDALRIRHWRESWHRWTGSYWAEAPDSDVRTYLYKRVEHASFVFVDGRSGIKDLRDWAPTRGKIANLTEAFAAVANLNSDVERGWTNGASNDRLVIPCRNGLLDVTDRRLTPPTPHYLRSVRILRRRR